MVPRAILVGTPRAWKNEVLPGSIPVLPAGTQTSAGAMAPARAGAATRLARILVLTSFRSPLVKMKPTLPQTLVLRVVGDEALDGTANLDFMDDRTYHSVLTHQDNGLATESETDLVHLLRADIVDTDNEDGLVLIEKALELIEVSGLGS
ncbi:uncharacterized protein AFUA_1G05090 [Aspergillus fumigatus Af293]